MANAINFDKRTLICLAIGASLPLVVYALLGTMGLSFFDESYFWYGAQRVIAGEVPIRDFEAYDIPRYYWAAGIMGLVGSKGILALRLSNAILLSITMAVSLFLIATKASQRSVLTLMMAASIFLLWLVPDFKVADFLSCVILIYGLAYLIEAPSGPRYFACGFIVGIAAMIGRNHGIYGVIGSLSAVIYLKTRGDGTTIIRALSAWVLGIFIGYLPMLIALAFIPSFFGEFMGGIMRMVGSGSTNITLPLPRPWWHRLPPISFMGSFQNHIDLAKRFLDTFSEILTACAILSLPFVTVTAVLYLFRKRTIDPVFAASVLLMLPYAHYTWSRADNVHLALGILPFLIAIMTFPATWYVRNKTWIFVGTLVCTILIMVPQQPGYVTLTAPQTSKVTVAGDQLIVSRDTAETLSFLNKLAAQYAPNGLQFVSAPYPGPYAVYERKDPVWETYGFEPRNKAFQDDEIARLKKAKIGFAVISSLEIDQRPDFLYSSSHVEIYHYVETNFRYLTTGGGSLKLKAFVAPK